ncbi:MAG: hypothetical protein EOP48_05575 [Sphingobacteriales bacterium]|nr:MAG: hypothetical protein EOP48_05575 [Sphingobacteriales bacterium]
MKISYEDLYRLQETWTKNNWAENVNEKNAFSAFCEVLPHFSEQQRDLIHELTERYLWLSAREYEERFDRILNSIDQSALDKCSRLYLFPIIKREDEHQIKSGTHCIYYFKGTIISLNPKFQDLDIILIPNYTELESTKFQNDGTDILLLIDDFIGSGDTFDQAWTEIKKNTTVSIDFIHVLSLALQADAFKTIKDLGFKLYFTEIRNRGISDYYSMDKEEKIKLMEEIENIINPPAFCSFGYKSSEALITLMRTPDNTFPFFWMKYELGSKSLKAPFYRK